MLSVVTGHSHARAGGIENVTPPPLLYWLMHPNVDALDQAAFYFWPMIKQCQIAFDIINEDCNKISLTAAVCA